jgi:hypothetical protein
MQWLKDARRSRNRRTIFASLAALGAVGAVFGVMPAFARGNDKEVGLHTIALRNGAGATNPGFESGSCPESPDGLSYGWHFVLTGSSSAFVSIEAEFDTDGVVTTFVSQPSPKHAYVWTTGPDTLVDVTAVVQGSASTQMVLSHICAPDPSKSTSSTSTSTSTTTTTTLPESSNSTLPVAT